MTVWAKAARDWLHWIELGQKADRSIIYITRMALDSSLDTLAQNEIATS